MDGLDFKALRMRIFGGPEYKGRYGCLAGLSLDGPLDGAGVPGSESSWFQEIVPAGLVHARIFAGLMEAAKYSTLGAISKALFEVGGAYRRNT